MANREIEGQYDIGTLYWDSQQGYTFETDKGIYEIYEGISLSGNTTSDIVFIMFSSYWDALEYVDWHMGAGVYDFSNSYEIIKKHYNSIA